MQAMSQKTEPVKKTVHEILNLEVIMASDASDGLLVSYSISSGYFTLWRVAGRPGIYSPEKTYMPKPGVKGNLDRVIRQATEIIHTAVED